MTLDLSIFNFDQWSWAYLVLAALMVVRERRVIPFVLCVFGAFVQGWLGIFLVVSIAMLDRLYTKKTKWLIFVQAMGLVSFFMAWHAPEVIRDYYLVFGVLCNSVQFRFGGLGVVVPLLLTHAYIPQFQQVEVPLGAAAFYLLLEETLRFSKVKQIEIVMKWVEIPVVALLLYPLLSTVEGLSLEPEVLGPFGSLAGVTLALAIFLSVKKVTFNRVADRIHSRGAQFYKWIHRGFSERRNWMREAEWSTTPGESAQVFAFWSAMGAALIWLAVVLISKGAMP